MIDRYAGDVMLWSDIVYSADRLCQISTEDILDLSIWIPVIDSRRRYGMGYKRRNRGSHCDSDAITQSQET